MLGHVLITLGMAAAVLAASSGCSLILDFDETSDASLPLVDGAPDAFLIPVALCVANEDDSTYQLAKPITPGTPVDAAICPNVDKDYYSLTLEEAALVTIDIEFTHAIGNIDMILYDTSCFRPELEPFFTGDSLDDNESVTLDLAPDTYIFQIFSKNALENTYRVSVTLAPSGGEPQEPCGPAAAR